jgi:hypothetical protein
MPLAGVARDRDRVTVRVPALFRTSGLAAATLALVGLAGLDRHVARAAAPAKRSAHRAAAHDPIGTLVTAVTVNSVKPGADLYAACRRSSFKLLAWSLYGARNRLSIEKSEYETEAEFQARKAKLESLINFQGDIIVCQPLDDNEDAPFTYDAETQAFKGTFRTHQNVWRDIKRTGSYVSRTRMGVRATVTASVDIEYDLNMPSLDKMRARCLKTDYLETSYSVPVAREKAPALKALGYLVFVGRLVAPFVDTSDSPGSPTLDDPHDVYERSITVNFQPHLVAVAGPGGMHPYSCELGLD